MANADLTAIIDGDSKGLMDALKGGDQAMKDFEANTGASLKKLDGDFKSTFGGIQNAISDLKSALAVAAPFAVLGVLHDQLEKGIDDWRKIGDAADKAALSTDFFQTLAYSASQAHIEQDKVADGLKKFAEQLAEIKHSHGDFYDWLKDNDGTLLKTLQGVKTVEDGVKAVSTAMSKEDDVIGKARLSVQAFGKDHRDFYRILGDGADAIAKAAEEARKYGVIVDESFIRKAQEAQDGARAVSNVIMNEFRLALLEIAPLLQDVGKMAELMARGLGMVRDAFVSAAAGMSNSGLNDQIRIHTENLTKAKTALDHLQSGNAVGGSVWNDLFGGENAEAESKKLKQTIDEETTYLKQFTDENVKRAKESSDRLKSVNKDFFENNGAEKDDKDGKSKLLEGQQAMDQLMKRYYTDVHQYYQAIQMDAQKERDHFKQMLEDKKITEQQYSVAMVLIAKDEATKIAEQYDHMREHIKTAMQGVSGEFEKILSDWQSGNKITLQSIEHDFVMMIERMVLKAAVLEPLFGTGKKGEGELGLVGNGLQSVFGGSGGGFSLSSIFGKLFHEGGVVGSGGPGRAVSAGTFAGAVRYHDGGIAGLMPGEVPAILKQNEVVDPGDGSVFAKRFGGTGHTFNISIQTPNPQAFTESQGQIAAMLSSAVARGQRNL